MRPLMPINIQLGSANSIIINLQCDTNYPARPSPPHHFCRVLHRMQVVVPVSLRSIMTNHLEPIFESVSNMACKVVASGGCHSVS